MSLFLRTGLGLVLVGFASGCDAGLTDTGAERVTAFTAGFPAGDGCALRGDGAVLCRGTNSYGRLGLGTAVEYSWDPENTNEVVTEVRFTAVAAGSDHSCALDGNGAAWCWGGNRYGQLGVADTVGPERCDGTLSSWPHVVRTTFSCATTPIQVATTQRFVSLDASERETCGLTRSGELWCWGVAEDRMGYGKASLPAECTQDFCIQPVRAAPGLTFRMVDLNYFGSCGVDRELQAHCWGWSNSSGRFGRDVGVGEDPQGPTPINSTFPVRQIALGQEHACAVTTVGDLLCFGSNSSGQLGDGTTTSRATPALTAAAKPLVAVSVGWSSTCALDADGRAWCWGANSGGNLGLGHSLRATTPQPVLGDLAFDRIDVGGGPVCARAGRAHWCWGQLPARYDP